MAALDGLTGLRELRELQKGEIRFEIDGVTRKAVVVITPVGLHLACNCVFRRS